MKKLIMWLWQLPQNIIAVIFLIVLSDKSVVCKEGDVTIYKSSRMSGGISLGNFIFLSNHSSTDEVTILHELGHCKQSRMLGLIYLVVIGLPSLIHATVCRGDYYKFYTERWADNLMNIKRD